MTTLALLPGVGADARLFARQAEAFPSLLVPPWIAPLPRESLNDYAARFAPHVRAAVGEGPVVVGGSSFGGMVACALAPHLHPARVVLIGSVRSPNDLPWPVRALRPFARVVPDFAFKPMRVSAPAMAVAFGARSHEERGAFADMLDDTPAEFIAWACRAIASWTPPDLSGVDVRAIHGAADRVLWSGPSRAQRLVPGAGHLLPLTHGAAVNEFIAEVVGSVDE